MQQSLGTQIGNYYAHGPDLVSVGVVDNQGRHLGGSQSLSVYRMPVVASMRKPAVDFGEISYVGCYVDRRNDRVFGAGDFTLGNAEALRLEVGLCIAVARNKDRFGLQAENEAWLPVNETERDRKFAQHGVAPTGSARDSKGRFVGAGNVMCVYNIVNRASIRPYFRTQWGNLEYMGYYRDNRNDRAVPFVLGLGDDIQTRVERAMEVAYGVSRSLPLDPFITEGFIQFGIQAGNEVWLDVNVGNGVKVGSHVRHGRDDNGPSNQDALGRELGGAERLSVYRISDPATWARLSSVTTQYGRITYIGCFVDQGGDRVYGEGPVSFPPGNRDTYIEEALRTVKRRQKARFGIEAGEEMWFPANNTQMFAFYRHGEQSVVWCTRSTVIVAPQGSVHWDSQYRRLGGPWALSVYAIPAEVYTSIP